MTFSQFWHRAFLERRPSMSLGLFRIAVAWTVAAHLVPSFFHLDENFLSTAFRTQNFNVFPIEILRLVEASPDWVVWAFVIICGVSVMTFALGLWSQASCLVMTITCYYFYARNNFQIGTLSFDILLVTLCLMCVTDYHGDFLSLDSLRRGKIRSYQRLRPIFLQRLLQLQLAWIFWYTALSKITAGGNWLTDNPYYSLMHYPPIGVVRDFPLRAWLGQHPSFCYDLGIGLLVFEFALPVLWFIPRARSLGISLGIAFQLMLWGTLHVPTIFLFLFPPMMLLFIRPETLVQWIEARQARHAKLGRGVLLYDGRCGFCVASVRRVRVLDVFGWVDPLDFHTQPDLSKIHPSLTWERCHSEMVLLEPTGRLSGGFEAFARLSRRLPWLWPVAPFTYLPGARWLGTRAYRWIAEHRYLLHRNPVCVSNRCALRDAPLKNGGASNN